MPPLEKKNVLQNLASRAREGDQAALHQLQRWLDLSLTRIVRRAVRTHMPQSVLMQRIQAMIWKFAELNKSQIAVQGETLTDLVAQRLLENVLCHLHAPSSTIEIAYETACFCSTFALKNGDSLLVGENQGVLKKLKAL